MRLRVNLSHSLFYFCHECLQYVNFFSVGTVAIPFLPFHRIYNEDGFAGQILTLKGLYDHQRSAELIALKDL